MNVCVDCFDQALLSTPHTTPCGRGKTANLEAFMGFLPEAGSIG
jgi:hypothetical protein